MAGKRKVWCQRLFGLQRAWPRLLATCLRGNIDQPRAEQKRDEQNHHGGPGFCQPTTAPSAHESSLGCKGGVKGRMSGGSVGRMMPTERVLLPTMAAAHAPDE